MIIAIIHVSLQCHSICSAMHSPLPETFLFLNQESRIHTMWLMQSVASPTLLLSRENQPHPLVMQREPAPPFYYTERTL